jgi:DNA-binding NarL/FixJ family response regulator
MLENRSIAVVAERHNFFNAGLAAVLQREVGLTQAVRAFDHAGLVEILAQYPAVDFLALDFDLPGAAGLATIRELHESHPAMPIAVFSDRTDVREVLSIIAAGAHGFIPRQIGNEAELFAALQTVADGGIFIPPCLIDPLLAEHAADNDGADSTVLNGLTERQQQVIRLLSDGHANKVIARELGISPSTVKVHVHAAFRAMGVHSRLAALAALRPARRASIDA